MAGIVRRRVLANIIWLLLVLAAVPIAGQAQNYSDLWWDPSNPGWALVLADHGDTMTGVLFGYDGGGEPNWLMIPTQTFSQNKRFFASDVYTVTGSDYNGPLNPNDGGIFRMAQVTMDFAPPGLPAATALFTFTSTANWPSVWGVGTHTMQIQRYPFGDAPANWGSDHTDLWWTPVRPDWGLALVQHGSSIFGVWYTYSNGFHYYNGAEFWPMEAGAYWYYFPAGNLNGTNALSSPFYFSRGAYLAASPFDGSGAVSSVVGNATVNFSGNPAMFAPTITPVPALSPWTLPIDGSTAHFPITPLQFGEGSLALFCVSPEVAPAPTIFTASPIALNAFEWITPLGNLNPDSGHVFPTDHIYFYFADPDEGESPAVLRTEVVAPGAGTVTSVSVDSSDPEASITVQATPTISYYMGPFIPDIPITAGMRLTAGQHLGTTGNDFGFDLGVVNTNVTQNFLNPYRYAPQHINADGPLKYYTGDLQRALYLKTHRMQPECDGKINYDIEGTLSGNWFFSNWATLSFARDTYDPSQVRINVPFGMKPEVEGGVAAINPDEIPPDQVTPATGKVVYTLTSARTGLPAPGGALGYLLVQMLDGGHVKAEDFGPSPAPPTDFTSQAFIFTR